MIKGAGEIFIPGNDTGCLVLHGFTGYPGEMKLLSNYINKKLGYTVYVPRLPGHATCGEDFLKTGARDWIRRSIDAYLDLSERCSRVFVTGLSMGGILATIIGVLYKVKKLVLYAPAHKVYKPHYKFLAHLFSLFAKKAARKVANLSPEDENDPVRRKLWEEYWRYNWFIQGKEFFKVQAYGNKLLKNLSSEVLVIVSKGDKSVPVEVADHIKKRVKGRVEIVLLEKSGHVVVNDVEKEKVFEETVRWLS